MANLDPAFWTSLQDAEIADNMLEGLVSFRPGTWDVVNTLAESFEPSSDHLRYHFKLKQGVPFHKGYGEVTAEDVKYSYERIAGITKPKINAVYQGDWANLQEVKVESKYAGTIIMKQPFSPLMRSTLPAMSGKVLSKKALLKLGKKFGTSPVGTGPYEFVSWTPQQRIELQKFGQYAGSNKAYAKPARWETITILPITDDSAAQTALQAGDIDFGAIGTGAVDSFMHGPLGVYRSPTLNYQWLSMNVQDPLLKNLNLRKAIRAAIDVPSVIEAAYNGKWERAYSIIPSAMGIGYWPDAPHYSQNIAQAKQYLSASGLSNVSLTLNCLNAEADKTAAQVIQSDLQQVGINLKIGAQDSATYYAIPGSGGGGSHRQLNYAFYVTEPDPSWSFVWFTCAQVGEWNWCDWCDPQWNALYHKATQVFPTAQRDQIYIQMQQQWDAQCNIVWIAYPTDYYAGKKSIKPTFRPDGSQVLWDFQAA